MIQEDYVSFEVAKLLKEKGFEGICDYAYSNKGNYFEIDRSNFDEVYCLRPTHQMATKWLREIHKLHIWIAHKLKQNIGLPWYYEIHNIETGTVVKIGDVVCGSYEVACEAALKYSLKNLI